MLAIPLSQQYQHQFPKADDLKAKLSILQDIQNTNQSMKSTSPNEAVINTFINKVISGTQALLDNLNQHQDVSIMIWRTIYETAVIFRVITEPIAIHQDFDTFKQLIKRYNDYSVIEEGNTFNNYKTKQKKFKVINYYKSLNKKDELIFEYDWSNPVFSERDLKKLSSPYHPSFRDLVDRSIETNPDYNRLLDNYKLSSNLVHMSSIANLVIEDFKLPELIKVSNQVLTNFITDYLNFLLGIYQVSNLKKQDEIIKVTKKWRNNFIMHS